MNERESLFTAFPQRRPCAFVGTFGGVRFVMTGWMYA